MLQCYVCVEVHPIQILGLQVHHVFAVGLEVIPGLQVLDCVTTLTDRQTDRQSDRQTDRQTD